MTIPMHDRLVASLKGLGAQDGIIGVAPRTTKYTVLKLDVLFKKDGDTLVTEPSNMARFWFVGRTGALRTVYGSPMVGGSQVVNDRIKRHLLETAPADVPRLARSGDKRPRTTQ